MFEVKHSYSYFEAQKLCLKIKLLEQKLSYTYWPKTCAMYSKIVQNLHMNWRSSQNLSSIFEKYCIIVWHIGQSITLQSNLALRRLPCGGGGPAAAAALRWPPCGGGPAAAIAIKYLFWNWTRSNLFKCILKKKIKKFQWRDVTKVFLEPRRLAVKKISKTNNAHCNL